MKHFTNIYSIFVILLLLISCNQNKFNYPIAKVSKQIDTLHSTEIVDNYHYFENENDSSVVNWYKKQELFTKNIFNNLKGRKEVLNSINEISKSESPKLSNFKLANDNSYFYTKRLPTENTSKLYCKKDFNSSELELFNPKTFKTETKKEYSINYFQPSWDGKYVAISLTEGDKEISEIVVFDVEKRKLLNDLIVNTWASVLGGIQWLSDNSGFIYQYIPNIDKNSKNYLLNTSARFHKLGSNNDKTFFSKKNNSSLKINEEDFPMIIIPNEKSKYIIGKIGGVSNFNDHYYATIDGLNNDNLVWKPLFKKEDKISSFSIKKDILYYKTAKNASNYKICSTSLKDLNFITPKTLVAESKNEVIESFQISKNGIYFSKIKNGVQVSLHKFTNNGRIKNIALPNDSGYIEIYSNGIESDDLWVKLGGWTFNDVTYKYFSDSNNFIKEANFSNSFYDFMNNIEVKEIEVPSFDNTLIPLSIVYNKNIKLDGENRVMLSAYGAYGFSDTPYMGTFLLSWIKQGGIYVTAHVRGGGEKGDSWHKGGFKQTKPNSWNDFIACTEYLINKKYTKPKRISIWSGSAGGIVVGRAITERPELYGAAIIRVGMLNTIRSEFGSNGKNNIKEFGSVKDSLEFLSLLEMDSYHHIKNGKKYPATYLTAGLNDSRGSAWETGKFAAKLQVANDSNNPILFSVDFNGGHGFNVTKNKFQEEITDIISFALWQTGHPEFKLDREAAFGNKKE